MSRRIALISLLSVVLFANVALGQLVIFDANFDDQPYGPLQTQSNSDPLPLTLPQSTIADEGCSVNVVPGMGDLTNKPVVFDAVAWGMATAAFINPVDYATGSFRISWDSLMATEPRHETINQMNVMIINADDVACGMKYYIDGDLVFHDADGVHYVYQFTIGVANHFDLYLDVDAGTYEFFIDDVLMIAGDQIEPGPFHMTYFRNFGRDWPLDLAPFVIDNFEVVAEDIVATEQQTWSQLKQLWR